MPGRWIYFVVLLFFPALSDAQSGEVCLGPKLNVVSELPLGRLYLTIDDSKPIYFEESNQQPRLVASDLAHNVRHRVKVYFDDRIVESWNLDFRTLGTSRVYIYRAPGSWRMEPVTAESCEAFGRLRQRR